MKTIMFNDEPYGLTDAVLSGVKTQTRRIVPDSHLNAFELYRADNKDAAMSLSDFLIRRGFARYVVGEVVAIAQSYKSIGLSPSFVSAKKDHEKKHHTNTPIGQQAGWSNKMYVAADFMPHHIRITGVRVEKLQSISDEDIAAEGVRAITPGWEYTTCPKKDSAKLPARNLRGAYHRLIDGVSKKQVFRKNPYVYVFEFTLAD